jgi:hypothetical protein
MSSIDPYVANSQGGFNLNDLLSKILNTSLQTLKIPGVTGGSGGGGNNNGTGSAGNDAWKNILPIILAAVSGGLENRAQKTTNIPIFDESVTPARDAAIKNFTDLLTKDPNLSGYRADQADKINNLADIGKRNTEEIFASRGVSGPAVASSLAGKEGDRISSLIGLNQKVPLLANQMKNDTLNNFTGFLNSNRGTQTDTSGNVLGGAVGGASELLTLLLAMGKL